MRRLRRKLRKMALPNQRLIPKSKLMVETLESRVLLSVVDSLRITEIMYNPIDLPGDSFGSDQYEYIELANLGSETIDLTHVSFVEKNYDPGDPTDLEGINFDFGSGTITTLAPGEYVLVVRNQAAFVDRYGTGLNSKIAGEFGDYVNPDKDTKLSDRGEHITLIYDPGTGEEIIHDFNYKDGWYPVTDSEGFSLQFGDLTEDDAEEWDDRDNWRPGSEFLGTPGEEDVFERLVIINEVMAHSHSGEPDWIEFYNPSDVPIDIGHWYLSDNNERPDFEDPNPDDWEYGYTKYVIPSGTMIPGKGYLVLSENTHFGIEGNPGVNKRFQLSDDGESVYLYSADAGGNLTGYFEERDFGASETNVSFGRYEKSTDTFNFVAMEIPTPGSPNSDPRVGPIVISEIMYHPADPTAAELAVDPTLTDNDFEYVELTNITGLPIILQEYDSESQSTNPWKFTRGIDFEFSLGTTIPGFGSMMVAKNPTAFSLRYGSLPPDVQLLGPFANDTNLRNGGERLEIAKPGEIPTGGIEVDRVYIRQDRINYDDRIPWPLEPDGQGKSLTRIHNDEYGNDAINWKAADPLNVAPTIDSFTDAPDPVTFGEDLTLTALVSDPGDVVTQVEFYHDANGNNVFDLDEDSLLVVDTNSADGWNWTGTTGSFSVGTNRYFVRARDDDEVWSSTATTVGEVNMAPMVDSLIADPDPVSQTSSLTLTAGNVADTDGTVVFVEFYRDTNGNNQLDPGSDALLGTDNNSSGGWSWSGSPAGFPLGTNRYFARVRDNDGAWSNVVETTGTILSPNDPPSIGSLTDSPDPVLQGNNLTLTANNVTDTDGNVVEVAFFRDANGNGTYDPSLDESLGSDINDADGWSWTGSTAGFPSGTNTFFAWAKDDKNDWSNVVTTTCEVQSPNEAPAITSLADSPDPVIEGQALTLTAYNVQDADGTITQVEFYRDTNENGFLDVGFDAVVGNGTQNSSDWSWTGSTAGFGVGQHRYFVRAQDDDGEWSNGTITTTGQVDPANEAPTVTSLSDSPDPVTRGADLTLTASGVADADGDETITKVEFYLDDGDGVFESGKDTPLGEDQDGTNDWSWTVSTTDWAAGDYTYFARVQDDFGDWSDAVSTTNTIEQFFIVGGLADSKAVKYTDTDGSEVQVKFKNVVANLYFEGIGLTSQVNGSTMTIVGATELDLVEMTQSPTGASLTFTVKGGDGQADLGGVTGQNLEKLTGKYIDLKGDINLTGYLGVVTLDDIVGNANITTQQASAKGVSLKADNVNFGATFDLADTVKKFQANRFTGGLLQADSVGKVVIKEGVFGAHVKALNGDILSISAVDDITGHLIAHNIIKKVVTKAGDFTGVARAGNLIGLIQALNLNDAIISAGETVKKVNIKNDITKSYILGGYDIGSDGAFGLDQPGGGDVLNSGSVLSVAAKGTFAESYVAAGTLPSAPLTNFLPSVGEAEDFGEIGKIKFGVVDLTSPDDFGLYAATDIKSVKVKDGPSATNPPFFVEDMNG